MTVDDDHEKRFSNQLLASENAVSASHRITLSSLPHTVLPIFKHPDAVRARSPNRDRDLDFPSSNFHSFCTPQSAFYSPTADPRFRIHRRQLHPTPADVDCKQSIGTISNYNFPVDGRYADAYIRDRVCGVTLAILMCRCRLVGETDVG